jgi:hypothetical protein
MSDEPREHTSSISRRSALKVVGAGAVVAWAAPTLTSVGSSAFAQSRPGIACSNCTPEQPCNVLFQCGAEPSGAPCPCITRADGQGCACTTNPCTGIACGADLSCPEGMVCTDSCCGRQCLQLCGAGEASASVVPGQFATKS